MMVVLRLLGLVWAAVPLSASVACAFELLEAPFSRLKSPHFKDRESAQLELLEWSRKQPAIALDELFRQSQSADDPEVRDRCFHILRELIGEQYAKEGEGFIGIALKDETQIVPNDLKLRSVIRVTEVHPDSPGQKARIQVNDLIVGLNDQIWYDVQASLAFREEILGMKPASRVRLRVLRGSELIDVDIVLARRPVTSPSQLGDPGKASQAALERAAKEAHFRRWLSQRKLQK